MGELSRHKGEGVGKSKLLCLPLDSNWAALGLRCPAEHTIRLGVVSGRVVSVVYTESFHSFPSPPPRERDSQF